MNKYSYPAVFTPEDNGAYSINFPDLEGCYTCGDSLDDGILMAEDILSFVLYNYENEGKMIPRPSIPSEISLEEKELINFIACDPLSYWNRFAKLL